MSEKKQELQVAALENGTVIDHIPSENLFTVVSLLGLEHMNNNITIGFNLKSGKLGTKGIIKIADKFFCDDEINCLWNHQNEPWVDSVLILIYSGWRISELLNLKTADIDLQLGTMTGGTKTKAGKGRIVPIHSLIRLFVERRMDEGGEYLFNYNGKKCSETKYRKFWKNIMDSLGIEKSPHECRHTFESLLDLSLIHI